ncbi:MAG: hypothetical protein HZC28_06950 [Spirochaetes bacterium]|nr:hypothetical protein [Spirochaetota bacterium]
MRRKNIFTDNIVAKVISLVLAVLVSLYVASQEDENREYEIPLRIMNVPQDLMIAAPTPKEVTVIVKGKKNKITMVNPKVLEANLDLTKSAEGKAMYKLTLNQEPQDIKWSLKPSVVEVVLERPATKMVRVAPVISGSPVPGYTAVSNAAEPALVEVTGPVSIVGDMDSVATETISLDKMKDTVVTETALVGRENVLLTVQKVRVRVFITADMGTNEFRDIIPAIDIGKRLTLANRNAIVVKRLVVQGPKDRLAELTAKQCVVSLNVKDVTKAGTFKANVDVLLPQGFELVLVEPASFELHVNAVVKK